MKQQYSNLNKRIRARTLIKQTTTQILHKPPNLALMLVQ